MKGGREEERRERITIEGHFLGLDLDDELSWWLPVALTLLHTLLLELVVVTSSCVQVQPALFQDLQLASEALHSDLGS